MTIALNALISRFLVGRLAKLKTQIFQNRPLPAQYFALCPLARIHPVDHGKTSHRPRLGWLTNLAFYTVYIASSRGQSASIVHATALGAWLQVPTEPGEIALDRYAELFTALRNGGLKGTLASFGNASADRPCPLSQRVQKGPPGLARLT